MIMAPVSMPPCQSRTSTGDAGDVEAYLTKKRASIHYPDDSTAAKRMSLHVIPRCRSLSESRAFISASPVVPEFSEKKDGSSSSSTSSLETTSSSPDTSRSSNAGQKKDEQPDQELLKTLASFLRGEGHGADNQTSVKNCRTIKGNSSALAPSIEMAASAPVQSAEVTSEELSTCDLVVTVRDFAYPKTHPFHIGLYPPEPVYEESDAEQDDEMEEEEEEEEEGQDGEDRTEGQARGLYDFDAENSSELSFREGEFLWIHCRQFPGWFVGEMNGKTGLVPENYVQLV